MFLAASACGKRMRAAPKKQSKIGRAASVNRHGFIVPTGGNEPRETPVITSLEPAPTGLRLGLVGASMF